MTKEEILNKQPTTKYLIIKQRSSGRLYSVTHEGTEQEMLKFQASFQADGGDKIISITLITL